jgi:5'-nucleotidase
LKRAQILLTNDDGIASPGLWAAAQALSALGFVHVVAPRDQSTAAGRSLPTHTDGIIHQQEMSIGGQTWKVYSVGGTPAQTVLHAMLEVLPEPPDLVVAGINFGENVGSGVTISGTVGAALEGASLGIPALAVSLETEPQHHYSLSNEVDFTAAAHFTRLFGELILKNNMPPDVDILKVDVPAEATPETPWMVTRLSRRRYFEPLAPERKSWASPGHIGYRQAAGHEQDLPDSDVYALRVRRIVSVTPLSLEMTSRIDLQDFEKMLRS